MNLGSRIFIGYFVIVGVAIWFVMQTFTSELVPGMRQSLEEVLVDTANILAETVSTEVRKGTIDRGVFSGNMRRFNKRRFGAVIWFMKKRDPALIVYITDASGTVIYDSRNINVGKDFSQWNDVYLTLKGEYGARSTREDENDDFSSIMYVAAPVKHGDKIIGVLTVGKPSVAVQPFIESAISNIRQKGLAVFITALVTGLLITYWLNLSISRLIQYARSVSKGDKTAMPVLREKELSQLANAMETMRTELEGKDYVESYLYTLTHEMKSPLTAIEGAAEILDTSPDDAARKRFIGNIRTESARLRKIIEELLGLAALEKRNTLRNTEKVDIAQIINKLVDSKASLLNKKGISIKFVQDEERPVPDGEPFLLQQAINNLLDNAIDFSPRGSEISIDISKSGNNAIVNIQDQGPGIPDYARDRLFERFYSLPRPETGHKSHGLGLSLVAEVAKLHRGSIRLENGNNGGACAILSLPLVHEKHT